MNFRTFWACSTCHKNYTSQRWGLRHLTTAHDGVARLKEFSPEYQRRLVENAPKLRERLARALEVRQ